MLGCRIRGNIAATNSGGNRGNVDDAPSVLINQWRQEGFSDVVDAAQVDRQHAMPEVIGMVQKLVTASVASVIDQDIYAAKAFKRGLCHALHLLRVRYIARDGQALTTHCLYLCHQLLEFDSRASSYGYIYACPCQCQGNTATNAAACTGHYCPPS